jgi:DNA-binding NarL/FixJ family response regulator
MTNVLHHTSHIRVMIVGGQGPTGNAIAAAVASQPDLDLVGRSETGADTLDQVGMLRPDVLLLDMLTPHFDSVAAIRTIGEQRAETKVLAYSAIVDDNLLLTALRAGAAGYVAQAANPAEIVFAIRTVSKGASYVPSTLAHYLIHHFTNSSNHIWSRVQHLTPREREVLTLVGVGHSNRQIAQALNISAATVRIHVRHAQKKLALETRSQLAAFGAQADIT